MEQAAVILKKGEGRTLKAGGSWIFDNEIDKVEGTPEDGSLVEVRDFDGYGMGTGFYNSRSKIRVRMMSRKAGQVIDRDFLRMRVQNAWDYRKKTVDTSSCRIIFGEADFFPGLTIDRFGSVLVAQTLSLGIEQRKDMLFRQLVRLLRESRETIEALYERNDVRIRELEGMEQGKGFYAMEGLRTDLPGVTEICENGILYEVDYVNGQKTGFFLDQKYNRLAAARLAPGRRVLDCFTHTGAFALNAAKAGASHVCAVDVSADALAMAICHAYSYRSLQYGVALTRRQQMGYF